MTEVNFDYRPWRGISRRTMEFYGVQTKLLNGREFEVAFPFGEDAVKVRPWEAKEFKCVGKFKDAGLFGQDRFDPGSKDSITICEGEPDALSAFEMLRARSACVSLKTGAGSAYNDCVNHYDYINSFPKIYLCFDNDKKGQDAIKSLSGLFDFRKIYHVKFHKRKDANEYLKNGESDEFEKTWLAAKRFAPDNIISAFSDIEKSLDQSLEDQLGSYPFPDLNDRLYGLHAGEVIVIKAQEGVGKQLPLTTRLPTPSGWTTVSEVQKGDYLIGRDGLPTEVIYVTETQYDIPCFELFFNDGTSVVAGGPHKWQVVDLQNREVVKTTDELISEGVIINNRSRYSIPVARELTLPDIKLPINPYLLGLWLGDGNSYSANITVGSEDFEEFCDQVEKRGHSIQTIQEYKTAFSIRLNGLTHRMLTENNLLKNKHIPPIYLRASASQRRELLRGLMDTDGGVQNSACIFYQSNKELTTQVAELVRSLGHFANVGEKQSKLYGIHKKIAYNIRFLVPNGRLAFSFDRKIQKLNQNPVKELTRMSKKAIIKIETVPSVPSKCLQVANHDHLYICDDSWTVTHNTELLRAIEHNIVKTTEHNIGIIHLEEDNGTTVKAIAGYELQVPAVLPDCGLSKEDILRGYRQAVRDDEGRIHIHSSFDVEDEDAFIGNIRFLVSAVGCRFIFLDHISWLATGLADEDERKKLDRLSQKLKLLAKELRFCLVEISHVNDDGKTRGSRNISKVANTVINLLRDVIAGENVVSIIVEKARLGGRTGPAGYGWFHRKTGRLEPFAPDVELPEDE